MRFRWQGKIGFRIFFYFSMIEPVAELAKDRLSVLAAHHPIGILVIPDPNRRADDDDVGVCDITL